MKLRIQFTKGFNWVSWFYVDAWKKIIDQKRNFSSSSNWCELEELTEGLCLFNLDGKEKRREERYVKGFGSWPQLEYFRSLAMSEILF